MAPLIMFPPPDLPSPGEVLLVTDELSSPADFLLHRSLSAHIKSGTHSKCVILAVAGDLTRWKAIAGKSNLNLADSLASGSLTYMELMPCAAGSDIRSGRDMPALKMLLDKLRTTLDEQRSQSHARVLIILDDIATLGWIGFSALALSRFARALCALCRRANAALVIRHHVVTPGEPDDLLRQLLQLCSYHLDVLPLSSGRSGAVSGQVALHAGPAVVDPKHQLVPRSRAIHYRLTDFGSVFFDRGTGGGVL